MQLAVILLNGSQIHDKSICVNRSLVFFEFCGIGVLVYANEWCGRNQSGVFYELCGIFDLYDGCF